MVTGRRRAGEMRHPEDVHGASSSWEARPCPCAWSSATATILTCSLLTHGSRRNLEARLRGSRGLSLTAHLGRLHSSLAVPRRRDDGIQVDRTPHWRKHCHALDTTTPSWDPPGRRLELVIPLHPGRRRLSQVGPALQGLGTRPPGCPGPSWVFMV